MANMSETMDQIRNFNLSEVEWSRVGVWPLIWRVFLFVLAVAAILLLTYFFTIKDRNLSLEQARIQEQTLKTQFEAKAAEAANLDRYRTQMLEMEESFGALVKQLPSKTEVPGLLEDIDEKGVDSRLAINSIELQAEKASEFYVELPIQVKVAGGYHDFGAFVSGVAGMPRIVTLHDFTIAKEKNSGNLNMTIQAKTYRYKEQE